MKNWLNHNHKNLGMFFLFILLSSTMSGFLRYEFIWDFCNYHYYNPWAFLHNRMDYDVAPASVNTYFNPFLDLIYYFLLEKFEYNPILLSAIQGSYYGVLLFVFWKINLLYFLPEENYRRLKILLSMLIGATGYASFSQMGTTTNEIQISILVMLAFYLLAKEIFVNKQRLKIFFAAGVLLGAAMGLKLTAVIYCVSLGVLLIVMAKNLKLPQKQILLFSLGGLLGFLVTNGYWMWYLWQKFENPVFPFANAIFDSEFFEDYNFKDNRYLPEGILEFAFYPFYWAFHTTRVVAEVVFFDIRFAIAEVMLFISILIWIKKRFCIKAQDKFLYGFMGLSYLIWLSLFGILRYLVPIEMLLGIFFIKMLSLLQRAKKWVQIVGASLFVSLLFIFITVCSKSDAWGRREIDKPVIWADSLGIENGALILQYRMPTAFLIPYLEKKGIHVRALSMQFKHAVEMFGANFSDYGKFGGLKEKIIESHKGQVVLVLNDIYRLDVVLPESELKYIPEIKCREVETVYDSGPLTICTYRRK